MIEFKNTDNQVILDSFIRNKTVAWIRIFKKDNNYKSLPDHFIDSDLNIQKLISFLEDFLPLHSDPLNLSEKLNKGDREIFNKISKNILRKIKLKKIEKEAESFIVNEVYMREINDSIHIATLNCSLSVKEIIEKSKSVIINNFNDVCYQFHNISIKHIEKYKDEYVIFMKYDYHEYVSATKLNRLKKINSI